MDSMKKVSKVRVPSYCQQCPGWQFCETIIHEWQKVRYFELNIPNETPIPFSYSMPAIA